MDHDSSEPSVSHLDDVINGSTVGEVLRAARLLKNAQKEEECLRFLRAVTAPSLVGEIPYMEIGQEFDLDFIKERTAVLVLFASIGNAMVTGQRIYSFRRLSNCKFVELLDRCVPQSAVGLRQITDRSILRILRWGFKHDNLLVLKEYERFLCAYPGRLLFNEYQILHMANRFDFPDIRTGILMKIRTVEDIEEFKRSENYELQLSQVDKELFDLRADIIKKCVEKRTGMGEDLFTFDVRNICSAMSSCASRYVELSEGEKSAIMEMEENHYEGGFNSEITGINF